MSAPPATKPLPVLQAGSFAYVLGRETSSGYGAGPVPREQALGSPFHTDAVARALHRRPTGFLRYTKHPSRRFVHKTVHAVFGRHGLSRTRNFLTYLRQRYRTSRVDYLPPLVFVDPSSACNLRCPGCATGLNLTRKRRVAALDLMRTVVDQVCRDALQISFYHLGEAFLNDDVFDAIAYARQRGLWTLVSSHLSLDRPRLAERIVESGLHELLVSCDGASPPVYAHYRRGGDLDLVMRNLRDIRAYRDRLGRRTPYLRTKMIVFEHNWHEVRAFEALALANGADDVQFVAGNGAEFDSRPVGGGSQFDIVDLAWKEKVATGPCQDVWLSMYLTPDGGAFSCCMGYKDEDLFVAPGGTLDVGRMWNAESYIAAREYFTGQRDATELPRICQACSYVTNFTSR